jgi:hypothetical protein
MGYHFRRPIRYNLREPADREDTMPDTRPLTRRELLRTAAVAAGTAALGSGNLAWAGPPGAKPRLPVRPFGQTGHKLCMLCLGTGQVARVHEFDKGVEIIRYALDSGITFIDTAKTYRSEKHVGQAIAGRRQQLFVATKSAQRGYDGALRELEDSLKLLGTDYLDLWYVHSVGTRGGDGAAEVAMLRDEDGVMKAMRKMKEQGVAKLIGFTGHTNADHMVDVLAAEDLNFDAMLFIISAAMAGGRRGAWEEKVLPAGRRRNLGLVAMKVLGGGRAVGKGAKKATPEEMLKYVWDRDIPVANVGLNSKDEIDAAVAACQAYAAKSKAESKPTTGGGQPPADDLVLRERFTDIALPFEQPGYQDGSQAALG